MATVEEIHRIQAYQRASARTQYESVAQPPFTLFFHPSSPLRFFNYAIPDAPVSGSLDAPLAALRAEFARRRRVPRLEFFESFAPALPGALLTHGFNEESRQASLLCTPAALKVPAAPPGLEIVALRPDSPAQDVLDYIVAQREGFKHAGARPVAAAEQPTEVTLPTDFDVVQARLDILVSGWQAFLARLDGRPAGSAMFSRPIDGVCQVAGIATRAEYRGRGIGSRLAWQAAQAAFDQGVEFACLTAADERAGQLYRRIGFQPFSNLLAFADEGA